MNCSLESLQEKEKIRYELLRELYERTNGDTNAYLNFNRIVDDDQEMTEIVNALSYLENEGLIRSHSFELDYSITHKGVIEIEESIRKPEKSTEHFSPTIIQKQSNLD